MYEVACAIYFIRQLSEEECVDVLKRILIIVFSILYILCVASCLYLLINNIELKEKFDYLSNDNKQKISQIANYEMEIMHLKEEIDQLKINLQEVTNTLPDKIITEENVVALTPGEIIQDVPSNNVDRYFRISSINIGDSVYERINGKSYRENANISLAELRYLQLIHFNFQHKTQVGEMIVNAEIAEDVIGIFKELYLNGYEVQSIYLVDNYWTGDPTSSDTESIENNNTSCFNYREVTGGGNLSNHAYGCAIDINPQQNPYVWYDDGGNPNWTHTNASSYIDRNADIAHVITEGDLCHSIFSKYGFEWGGNWINPIDYQHFQKKLY